MTETPRSFHQTYSLAADGHVRIELSFAGMTAMKIYDTGYMRGHPRTTIALSQNEAHLVREDLRTAEEILKGQGRDEDAGALAEKSRPFREGYGATRASLRAMVGTMAEVQRDQRKAALIEAHGLTPGPDGFCQRYSFRDGLAFIDTRPYDLDEGKADTFTLPPRVVAGLAVDLETAAGRATGSRLFAERQQGEDLSRAARDLAAGIKPTGEQLSQSLGTLIFLQESEKARATTAAGKPARDPFTQDQTARPARVRSR